MDEPVEFYAACDPLVIPKAVQEVITKMRQHFTGVIYELLYEPDAHWFRCLTTRASKERVYQFLVQMICSIASEEISFSADVGFEGMPFFNARTIAWNDYLNCREVQFKFDDECIYPDAVANFPHRGVWENFGTCRLQTLSELLNEFSCILGPDSLQQFSLVTRCTISHNLRQDIVFLMSDESMQAIQNCQRALDSLINACNMGIQITHDRASIYHHHIVTTDAEQTSFRFTRLRDLGLLNKTCDVKVDPKRASVLRTVHLRASDQRISAESVYPDVQERTWEGYYHEVMRCSFLSKAVDTPGIYLHQARARRADPDVPESFSYRIDAWRSSVVAPSASSFDHSDIKSIALPGSKNDEDLIDLFSTVMENEEPEKSLRPDTGRVLQGVMGTVPAVESEPSVAIPANDLLSYEPVMQEADLYSEGAGVPSSQQNNNATCVMKQSIGKIGARATLAAVMLKTLIRTLFVAPNATSLKLEIGRAYFASQPSHKANSLFPKSTIASILKGTGGLPPMSNYSSVVSTYLSDVQKVAQMNPSRSTEWDILDGDVCYQIFCTAYRVKKFTIQLNASTLEFHCGMPATPCVNAFIHCPENAWDLNIKVSSQDNVDESICNIARKAVQSMKIAHDPQGNPVIEVMDLTRFGAMINDVRLKYSSRFRCNRSQHVSMTLSWHQSMERRKGLIRHEPSNWAGNTWMWKVSPPQTSRQWLTVSFGSTAVNHMLQMRPRTEIQESDAKLEALEAGGELDSLCHIAIGMVGQMDCISPDPDQIRKASKQSDSHAGQKRAVELCEQEDDEEYW